MTDERFESSATTTCGYCGVGCRLVLGVEDEPGEPLRVHVETTATTVGCTACGTRASSPSPFPRPS